jgi:hypothetical protein
MAIWLSFAIISALCACWFMSGINYEPKPNVPSTLITVTQFYVCSGLDDKTGGTTIFSSAEKQISVCGSLQTNQPITVSVRWYHEHNTIFREVINDVQNHFISSINPIDGAFPEGNYQIHLSIGRSVVWRTEFQIQQ